MTHPTETPIHELHGRVNREAHAKPAANRASLSRIAVGVDGFPEGRDAATLGAAIATATGAELMLVEVHGAPLFPVPPSMSWKSLRGGAEATLRDVRDSLAPGARIAVETDFSIPRALHRVVRTHHRDLLVLGSSRQAPEGHVRIGKRTRELLWHFKCAIAVAPRGLHERGDVALHRIGVGYDGGPESEAALDLAGCIALAADAELHIRAVVDDRIPVLFRSPLAALASSEWIDVIDQEAVRLDEQARAAALRTGARVKVEVAFGRPADPLLALSGEVDLMVVGSRRWGPSARVPLGSTGEALFHDAECPVLAVPKPTA